MMIYVSYIEQQQQQQPQYHSALELRNMFESSNLLCPLTLITRSLRMPVVFCVCVCPCLYLLCVEGCASVGAYFHLRRTFSPALTTVGDDNHKNGEWYNVDVAVVSLCVFPFAVFPSICFLCVPICFELGAFWPFNHFYYTSYLLYRHFQQILHKCLGLYRLFLRYFLIWWRWNRFNVSIGLNLFVSGLFEQYALFSIGKFLFLLHLIHCSKTWICFAVFYFWFAYTRN